MTSWVGGMLGVESAGPQAFRLSFDLDEPPPSNLLPTPDQQRRRRSAKSPRTTREASPQPPLTALQRLSSARKQARSAPPTASMTNTASGSSSHTGTPADPVSKPVSKLALLAQKRKEAARARETLPSGADTPPESSIAAAVLPDQAKPLSKLAQKTAAAKVRSVASTRETSGAVETTGSGNNITEDANASPDQIDEISSALFSAHISNGLNLPAPKLSNRPSPFFSIVTSSSPITTDSEGDPPLTNMHLPLVRDPAELERRIREAFGPDVESPDDIVLRARQGRAGTADERLKGTAAHR